MTLSINDTQRIREGIPMKSKTSYMICATPRTGSTLLCLMLRNTGLAGNPREYFSVETESALCEKWGVSGFRQYFDRVNAESTTSNGVFGFKIMARDFYEFFIPKLQGISPTEYDARQEYDLLHHFYPDLRYIWMTRRNKIRQAVSFSKACQTTVWAQPMAGGKAPRKDPHYRFNSIDLLMQRVVIQEALWQDYFDRNKIKPLILFYEDFVNSYEETVMQMLRFIGVEAPADLPLRRDLKKQADHISDLWVERFIREKWEAIRHT